jgi:hypothetical protein
VILAAGLADATCRGEAAAAAAAVAVAVAVCGVH